MFLNSGQRALCLRPPFATQKLQFRVHNISVSFPVLLETGFLDSFFKERTKIQVAI
jgi:hypothetical protein